MAVIGFFDSGIGGLTVLHEAMKKMPQEQFLYYADTDHVPYGTKTPEEICRYTKEAAAFLMEKGADILVIACNTATSAAIHLLRAELPIPIVGMEPAVKPAVTKLPDQKILVCATPITVEGEKLHHLLETEHASPENVHLLPLPELVKWAEKGEFSTEVIVPYLQERIGEQNYAAVVLGCTHFTLFRDSFRKILGDDILFIDGTNGTVNRIKSLLDDRCGSSRESTRVRYYRSGREILASDDIAFIETIYTRLNTLDEYISQKEITKL